MKSREKIPEALLRAFIEESMAALDAAEQHLLALERGEDDQAHIAALFRTMHSIKGNASFFGLGPLKTLAHALEELLSGLREKSGPVSRECIDGLLRGADEVQGMLRETAAGQPLQTPEALVAQVSRLTQRQAGGEGGLDALAAALANALPALEDAPKDIRAAVQSLKDFLFREGHDGCAAGTGPSHQIADMLERFRKAPPNGGECAALREALARLDASQETAEARELTRDMLETYDGIIEDMGFDDLLADLLEEKLTALRGLQAEPPQAAPMPMPAPEPEAEDAPRQGRSMRVSGDLFDVFAVYIHGLAQVRALFENYRPTLCQEGVSQEALGEYEAIVKQLGLYEDILETKAESLRKIPMETMFAKLPRLVRDTARALNKNVVLRTEGSEVAVDKGLADVLDAPLLHLVRNAVDHGIEAPAERRAAGKPAEGEVRVSAREAGGQFVIEVADDGAGLDLNALEHKARAMGILAAGEQPGAPALCRLVFAPGLSTRAQASEISGRGVGMDVVRRMIELGGGAIEVETERGRGTRFRIVAPKSMLVSMGL